MADKTGIEWTDATWNPVRGCSRVSPGCVHCYAETFTRRFAGPGQHYEGLVNLDTGRWSGVMQESPHMLDQPLRWKRPRTIFVNSMSDLFHKGISSDYIAACFGVMSATQRHRYQILTKRPEQMLAWSRGVQPHMCIQHAAEVITANVSAQVKKGRRKLHTTVDKQVSLLQATVADSWPLPNVWMGTSVEDEKRKDRIDILRQVPATIRFLSIEPLLEDLGELNLDGIDWVIVGGESGPGARRMLGEWVRNIRDQCVEQKTPFFFKQWGAFNEAGVRVGKKEAGKILDDRTWSEMPNA